MRSRIIGALLTNGLLWGGIATVIYGQNLFYCALGMYVVALCCSHISSWLYDDDEGADEE